MAYRSHPLLSIRFWLAGCVLLLAARTAHTQFQTYPAIVGVPPNASIEYIAESHQLQVMDSLGEHHLVWGSAPALNDLALDGRATSVEAEFGVDVSEAMVGADSAWALLNPETVALLNDAETVWHGGSLVRKAFARQRALELIEVEHEDHDPMGAGVRVAVIDTGVDGAHPALAGHLLPGFNFVDGGSSTDDASITGMVLVDALASLNPETVALLNPSTVALLNPSTVALLNNPELKFYGHGTLVSGLIHAVAPEALIVPLKAFDATGRAASFTVAKAIRHAADLNVDVINMSFDFDRPSSVIQAALDYAAARGVVLIASAGNNATEATVFPAAHPRVLSVAATDREDKKTPFSNFGPAVGVAAPGDRLISTYPGGNYAAVAGTSFAAALVSGEAALLRSGGVPTAQDVYDRIRSSVKRISDKNPGLQLGAGRIDIDEALEEAIGEGDGDRSGLGDDRDGGAADDDNDRHEDDEQHDHDDD